MSWKGITNGDQNCVSHGGKGLPGMEGNLSLSFIVANEGDRMVYLQEYREKASGWG